MRPCLIALLFLTLYLTDCARGQDSSPPKENPTTAELQSVEKEVAERDATLKKHQQDLKDHTEEIDRLQKEIAELKKSPTPDEKKIKDKETALQTAESALKRDQEAVTTAQQLLDKAKEKLELAQKNADLQTKKPEPANADKPGTPIKDALEKKQRLEQARVEAGLAQQKVGVLQEQINVLTKRREEIRKALDAIALQLMKPGLENKDRERLTQEQRDLREEDHTLNNQLYRLQRELLVAEAQQRLKQETAQREEGSYAQWKQELYVAGGLISALILFMLVSRLILMRRIRDPQRRFYVKRGFSLLVMVIFIVGMIFIFANRFSNLLTLLGLALAGITIALQDLIASFVAWFFIRGAKIYRVGDWVRLGDQTGEVIDVTFLRTVLQQTESFSPQPGEGHRGGNVTGGLTVMMNNSIFKHPVVNYTRGYPFIWCSLRYVITFESDWEEARQRIQNVVKTDPEIRGTSDRAKEKMAQMAEDFSIRLTDTEPGILTWTADKGVELTVWFLTHPRRRVILVDKINCLILRTIQDMENANFAYNTIRSVPTPPDSSKPVGNGQVVGSR